MKECYGGDINKVKKLIKDGADVNAKDIYGNPAIMRAARSNRADIIELLWKNGANVNVMVDKRRNNPLLLASFQGSANAVKALVKCGAYVNVKNQDGETPLMLASCWGYKDIVEILLKTQSTKINIRDRWGDTALDTAVSRKNVNIIKLLRKYGAKTAKELEVKKLESNTGSSINVPAK
jgi:ankyrin repeat protein